MNDTYGKAIEALVSIVSDENQPQSEKAAAIEIAANLNYLYNEQILQPGECCFQCGYEHLGAPGYGCSE